LCPPVRAGPSKSEKKMLDLDAIFDPDRPINARPRVQQLGRELREQPGRVIEHDAPGAASQTPRRPITPADPVPLNRPRGIPAPPSREWDDEAQELIGFFQSARPRLPRTPFRLTRWQYISDPAKWYRSLELDISSGPLGCRARMGALQEDLRRLREYLSSRDSA
jgi:hypothetical protein